MTLDVKFFVEESGANLMERHERRQCRQSQQRVESQGYDIAHNGHGGKSLLENIGQSDEDQRCSTVGADTYGEGCGENHQSGKDGYETVYKADLYGRLNKVCLAAEIAGVCAETAHSQGKRIERLSQRSKEHVAAHLRKIGHKEKLDSLASTRQQTGSNDNDEQ